MRVERALAHYSWTSVTEPVYVVELWTLGGPAERWRLLDAEDVEDVLEWARSRQRGRLLSVSLEHQDEYGTSVLRLLGPAHVAGGAIRSA
ncbi:hypothetical protein [Cellulomonas sp. P5_C6]